MTMQPAAPYGATPRARHDRATAQRIGERFRAVSGPALDARAGFAWTFAGNAGLALCQWLALVAIARLGNPTMVGQYALGLAVTAPIVLLFGFSLRTVLVTDTDDRYAFKDYLALRLICAGFALLACGLAVSVAGVDRTAGAVVMTIALAKCIDLVADLFVGLHHRAGRFDLASIAFGVNGLLTVVSFAGVLSIAEGHDRMAWAASGSVVASLVALGVIALPGYRRAPSATAALGPTEGFVRRTWPLLQTALPLGFAAMLGSLNLNIPRYALEHVSGAYQLGIFSALAYVILAGNTVVGAVAQVALPKLSAHAGSRDKAAFTRLLARLLGFAVALGLTGLAGAVLLGERALSLLYGREYAAELDTFVWLVAAAGIGFVNWFLDYAVSAARRFGQQLRIGLLTTAALTAGCLLVVPSYGATGAAWMLCLAGALQSVLKLLDVRRTLRVWAA